MTSDFCVLREYHDTITPRGHDSGIHMNVQIYNYDLQLELESNSNDKNHN